MQFAQERQGPGCFVFRGWRHAVYESTGASVPANGEASCLMGYRAAIESRFRG